MHSIWGRHRHPSSVLAVGARAYKKERSHTPRRARTHKHNTACMATRRRRPGGCATPCTRHSPTSTQPHTTYATRMRHRNKAKGPSDPRAHAPAIRAGETASQPAKACDCHGWSGDDIISRPRPRYTTQSFPVNPPLRLLNPDSRRHQRW